MKQEHRELALPVARALRWAASLADGEDRLVCREHRIEHTGKSACVALGAVALFRFTGEREWLDLAVRQGRRLVARLEREGTSPCHTFRPGRHDPFNCSNSVIDGGACSDALSTLVLECAEHLSAEDADAFRSAAVLHARTYLRYAVLDKGIPAQRAWGLTGLAGACAAQPADELSSAAIEAVGVLEAIQHGDGSYPYHPLEWGAEHPGAADVSCFYQSRCTAFLLFALERLGREPSTSLFRAPIVRGLDYLTALVGPDGCKPGLVEAKPWYWGAEYEVASHPFDVYALARGAELFGRRADGRAALRAYRAWSEHLLPSGEPRSHLDAPGRGRSYQCPLFWAAHAGWIARALPDLAAVLDREGWPAPPSAEAAETIDLHVTVFPDAQLARLEDARVVAWVRGARPSGNVHHGSRLGAGLVRVVSKRELVPLVERRSVFRCQEGEWCGRSGAPKPVRGLASGRSELRFGLWLARVEARAGRRGAALATPLALARRGVLDFASSSVASSFDRGAQLVPLPDGVRMTSALAWRDGARVAGSSLERIFRVEGDGLAVEERVVDDGGARGLAYRVPARAEDVEQGPREVRYRLGTVP